MHQSIFSEAISMLLYYLPVSTFLNNSTHAFTNSASTATGIKFNMSIKYNSKADKKILEGYEAFFERNF